MLAESMVAQGYAAWHLSFVLPRTLCCMPRACLAMNLSKLGACNKYREEQGKTSTPDQATATQRLPEVAPNAPLVTGTKSEPTRAQTGTKRLELAQEAVLVAIQGLEGAASTHG